MKSKDQRLRPKEETVGNKLGRSSTKIPVITEQLHISKQVVETGRVRVSKKVIKEEVNKDIPVLKEEVIVERKEINQYIDGAVPGIRMVGDTTIIPVVKEVVVKRLLLVEELHVTKRTSEQLVPVHETLIREEVTVNRKESKDTPASVVR